MPLDPFTALGIDRPSETNALPSAPTPAPTPAQQSSGGLDPMAALGVDTSQQYASTPVSQQTAATPKSDVQAQAWHNAGINPLPPSSDKATEAVRQWLTPDPDRTYGEIMPLSRDSSGGIHPALPQMLRRTLYGLTESPSEAVTIDPASNSIGVSPEAASVVPWVAGGAPRFSSVPATAVAKAGDALPEVTGAAEQASSLPLRPSTADEAKAIASAHYQAADTTGGTLTPAFTNKFIDAVQKIAPQTEEGLTVAGPTPITSLGQRIQALQDKPISLQGAQEIDEALGGLIDKEYGVKGLSKDGKNLLDLQSTLRDMIANAGADDVEGGNAGFDAIAQARQAWAQAMKMGDLERIAQRASLTDNPATSIRSGIRVLLSNPTRARGYSDDEIAALKDAADRGVLGRVFHVFGSRLLPIGAALVGEHGAGPIGAAVLGGAAHGGTSLMRAGAEALQNSRLQNALDTVARGVPAPPGWKPPPLQIQPPDVLGSVPWRPLLTAPTQQPATSRNPATGLPEFSLEANRQVASGDMAQQLAGRMLDGSLSDHKSLNELVSQNKRQLRAQFGGQGIQNIVRVGALVRHASTEETPSTVLSAILKGAVPAVMSKAGDASALIAKAIVSPELTKTLASRSKGSVNKLGQNRLLAALSADDAKRPVGNVSSNQDEPAAPVSGGGDRVFAPGAGVAGNSGASGAGGSSLSKAHQPLAPQAAFPPPPQGNPATGALRA